MPGESISAVARCHGVAPNLLYRWRRLMTEGGAVAIEADDRVTGNQDDSTLLALFNLGVSGFAPKTSNSGVIEAAIRLILAGGRYLPPSLLDIASQRGGESSGMPNRLTPRQIDVLKLISTGHSNKEIARDLDLSPATIKAHTSAAIAVLGAVNRAEAVFKARELGLI